MTSGVFSSALFVFLFVPAAAFSQSLAIGGHISSSRWSEFDGSDHGLGGRLTWMPASTIGIDADLTWYPSDFPEGIAFSRRRIEGLVGATVGPRVNRVRPFVKAAAGFVKVGATPGAFACITIFPPPLACVMAGGHTLPAYEIGGGVEVSATPRTFFRADIADRILKYPGPAFDSNFDVRDHGFIGHGLRFTIGGGWRF